jgi:hypothetical protein
MVSLTIVQRFSPSPFREYPSDAQAEAVPGVDSVAAGVGSRPCPLVIDANFAIDSAI